MERCIIYDRIKQYLLLLEEDSEYIPAKLKSDYRDVVVQQEFDKLDDLVKTFWKNELQGCQQPLLFTGEPASCNFWQSLDSGELARLKKLSFDGGIPIKAIALSAFLYTIKLLNYENEVLIGLVTNTRPDTEDGDKILGCFLNTIPFRFNLSPDESCMDFIRRVQEKIVALKERERLSILEISKIEGIQQAAGNALFDIIFNFTDFHAYDSLAKQIYRSDGDSGSGQETLNVKGQGLTNSYLDFLLMLREDILPQTSASTGNSGDRFRLQQLQKHLLRPEAYG